MADPGRLKALGGSGRIEEIAEAVIELEGFTEEQQAVRRREGDRMTMIEYRLAWARNYLKNIGAIENSARGVWSITDAGRAMEEDQMLDLVRSWKADYSKDYYERRKAAEAEGGPSPDDEAESIDEGDWRDGLLTRLLDMAPDAFERLAQRLLREAGFRNVEVLGRVGDGGLDGVGVYRLSLVSFPVYFQCKRYKGSVSASAVRDFRGAMAGRGEKGLLHHDGNLHSRCERGSHAKRRATGRAGERQRPDRPPEGIRPRGPNSPSASWRKSASCPSSSTSSEPRCRRLAIATQLRSGPNGRVRKVMALADCSARTGPDRVVQAVVAPPAGRTLPGESCSSKLSTRSVRPRETPSPPTITKASAASTSSTARGSSLRSPSHASTRRSMGRRSRNAAATWSSSEGRARRHAAPCCTVRFS